MQAVKGFSLFLAIMAIAIIGTLSANTNEAEAQSYPSSFTTPRGAQVKFEINFSDNYCVTYNAGVPYKITVTFPRLIAVTHNTTGKIRYVKAVELATCIAPLTNIPRVQQAITIWHDQRLYESLNPFGWRMSESYANTFERQMLNTANGVITGYYPDLKLFRWWRTILASSVIVPI